RGVRPGSVVGVALERSAELVAALLAVLRAGAAYLPLDPDHPAERLAYLLGDAGARVLLARGAAPEGFAGEVVRLDAAPDRSAATGAEDPRVPVWAESLAYVVYTSGSTGRPKGVAMTHGALANHMAWMQRAHPLAAGDRVLQKTAVGFDASVWEFWAPLTTGATLVMAPPGAHRDPAALLRAVAGEGVTVLQLVPSMLPPMLDAGLGRYPGLRRLFCGGEALPAAPAARARAETGAEVVNLYGPTEVCIDATWHPVAEEAGPAVPIGRPVDGVRAYVLDRGLRPAPTGVAGELFLGGVQLARGYLGRPDLTAERFVPDGVSGDAGARLYRTGDRVRWLAGGELEYLGRLDEQVKVRGFRIEPGEIEGALREHPGVRQAVVVAREAAPGDARLVAYVVPSGGEAPPAAELRAWARRRLPEHMVPGAFVPLEALPLTASGKVDRRALPESGAAEAGEAYVAPRTPTEEILAGIWADVLRRDRVGAADDFFALGGHSLLATRVVSRVREAFGVELPLRALFEAPTVAALVERVGAGAATQAPPLVPVPRDGSPLPLSFAQQRLWFIDRLQPGSPAYNMPFPLRVRGGLEVRALERALTEIVRRHESLRTGIVVEDGEPVQRVDPARPVRLPTVDLGGVEASRELERLAAEEAARPFDLAAGRPLRATVVRLGEEDAAVLFTMHHVASDGWSIGVFVREVSALYEGARLPELPVQYADYAVWQR
ncbi:MAG TPA: amino acid adenylation domain-containing protein, partial [Longimicrobiaceae bacterium]